MQMCGYECTQTNCGDLQLQHSGISITEECIAQYTSFSAAQRWIQDFWNGGQLLAGFKISEINQRKKRLENNFSTVCSISPKFKRTKIHSKILWYTSMIYQQHFTLKYNQESVTSRGSKIEFQYCQAHHQPQHIHAHTFRKTIIGRLWACLMGAPPP